MQATATITAYLPPSLDQNGQYNITQELLNKIPSGPASFEFYDQEQHKIFTCINNGEQLSIISHTDKPINLIADLNAPEFTLKTPGPLTIRGNLNSNSLAISAKELKLTSAICDVDQIKLEAAEKPSILTPLFTEDLEIKANICEIQAALQVDNHCSLKAKDLLLHVSHTPFELQLTGKNDIQVNNFSLYGKVDACIQGDLQQGSSPRCNIDSTLFIDKDAILDLKNTNVSVKSIMMQGALSLEHAAVTATSKVQSFASSQLKLDDFSKFDCQDEFESHGKMKAHNSKILAGRLISYPAHRPLFHRNYLVLHLAVYLP